MTAAYIVFYSPRQERWDGAAALWREISAASERREDFASLAEAAERFRALYAEYPHTVFPGDQHQPQWYYRAAGNASVHGATITLYYVRDGVAEHPSWSAEGVFYRGPKTRPVGVVAGRGYMRPRDGVTIPQRALRGERKGTGYPILIDGIEVGADQIREAVAGPIPDLPAYITALDFSGSFLYLRSIDWGDVTPDFLIREINALR